MLSKFKNKSAILLRKITNTIFVQKQQEIEIPENVIIHPSSKIRMNQISLKPNCSVFIDENTQIQGRLIFDRENASISVGKRVFLNGSIIAAKNISIGDDVLVSWGVTIVDHNSHSISFSKRSEDVINWREGKKDWTHVKIAPVNIKNKVWIGFNSIILKGVTLGEGSIVGAGSVVTKDVPPWTIVAGNPTKIIREIPEDER
jgi:acetyltransferase-like isoleucine patch superfamily enzyme